MDFIKRLPTSVYLFDGAMGTMLYAKGVFIKCYDRLNLRNAKSCSGAQAVRARRGRDPGNQHLRRSRLKLATSDRTVRLINYLGCRDRAAGGGRLCLVAGAIGPLGIRIEPYGPTSIEEAGDFFRSDGGATRWRRPLHPRLFSTSRD